MLLSEAELRSALQPLLDRALAERLKLFQLQLEPRLQALLDAAMGDSGRRQAELGARLAALLRAEEVEAVFEALWQATGHLGAARALLVQWRQELAIWRSEGTSLPARFALGDQSQLMKQGNSLAVRVREQAVGWLYWEGSKYNESAQAEELKLALRATGLSLLECGLREPPQSAQAQLAPAVAASEGALPSAPKTPAQRFAWLLLEDLAVLLQRDRPEQWQRASEPGAKSRAFAGELERCRKAFSERYPEGHAAFEEAARGWAN
ncbi:MAG: hypothetical protein ACRD2D_12295 [Terriglobales bacterium]